MRVLLGPRAGLFPGAWEVAAALAGGPDQVVPLSRSGVTNLARGLSPAEVHAVRRALEGGRQDGVVGYVCRGRRLEAPGPEREGSPGPAPAAALPAVALPVADHANLTWVSPLTGPNNASLGPRFPTAAGIYRPKLVQSLLAGEHSQGGRAQGVLLTMEPGVVLQVSDLERPTAFVLGIARRLCFCWISDELTPVALLAAHRGLAVAAVVLED